MTDLNTVSDDDLLAEVSKRLGEGRFGFHGLISPHQMDYRASYHQILLLSADWSNTPGEHDNKYVRELRQKIEELSTTVAVDPGVYAVNTTFHGRSAFEDHAPKPV